MPFVKLDCAILDSTIWFDKHARDVFLTALLMAEPGELLADEPQIAVQSLQETGWRVPPGWYGIVAAAGPGIVQRAGVEQFTGMAALERLGSPEPGSRTRTFDGRRLVRVNGGYVVLNFMAYRDRDYTSAARSKRYRDRKKVGASPVTPQEHAVTGRDSSLAVAVAVSSKHTDTEATIPTTALARRADAIVVSIREWQDVDERVTQRLVAKRKRDLQAELVFAYWSKVLGHESALYDRKRAAVLRARLKENAGDVSELLSVVDGARKDPHLMGEKPESDRKYDGIETLFRDRAQVERLATLGNRNGAPHKMAARYAGLCAP
jgi:hypothetical protein